jgi:hypothetical protein
MKAAKPIPKPAVKEKSDANVKAVVDATPITIAVMATAAAIMAIM